MRILIVDDNRHKRERVAETISKALAQRKAAIEQAADYEAALKKLQHSYFDLVILDILLPAADGTPSQDSSKALIRQLNKGDALVPPMHIIGLTAYKDVATEQRDYFDQHLLSLEHYSEGDTVWADKIASRVDYLMNAERASLQYHAQNFGLDVFVIAARHKNEFLPIKSQLFKAPTTGRHPLWRDDLTTGSIALADGRTLEAALCCVNEMGMAPTAAIASQAISIFRPRLIAMVGMCCGFFDEKCSSPRKMMDVIVAREVSCWEEGKYDALAQKGEFKNRSRARMVDDLIRDDVDRIVEQADKTLTPALRKIASRKTYKSIREHFAAKSEKELVREVPEVKYAPIVSGSSVIADQSVVREIIDRHPNAIGLDMELFGLYAAADRAYGRRPSVLGVKGVADFGEVDKDDTAQIEASKLAAEVFKSILSELKIFSES